MFRLVCREKIRALTVEVRRVLKTRIHQQQLSQLFGLCQRSKVCESGQVWDNPLYSNQGFNTFVGPGYLGVDGALHKKIRLPWFGMEDGSTLTLGVEGSNIINRVNLTGPASADLNTVSAYGLGVAQGANQARIFQVVSGFPVLTKSLTNSRAPRSGLRQCAEHTFGAKRKGGVIVRSLSASALALLMQGRFCPQ